MSAAILDEGGLQPPGRADIGNNPAVAVFICEIRGVEPSRLMGTPPTPNEAVFSGLEATAGCSKATLRCSGFTSCDWGCFQKYCLRSHRFKLHCQMHHILIGNTKTGKLPSSLSSCLLHAGSWKRSGLFQLSWAEDIKARPWTSGQFISGSHSETNNLPPS